MLCWVEGQGGLGFGLRARVDWGVGVVKAFRQQSSSQVMMKAAVTTTSVRWQAWIKPLATLLQHGGLHWV